MDKFAHFATPGAACTNPAPGLEQMPQDVLRHILHYLPIPSTRNTFSLLSKGYLASTDYLRIAGLVLARIRSMDTWERQVQAISRFTRLIDDCMNQRLPASTKAVLLMESTSLLRTLSDTDLLPAMRLVLASSKLIDGSAGREVRGKCMEEYLFAYQSRKGRIPEMPCFDPINDEEAVLAATHFYYDQSVDVAPPEKLLTHMEILITAMGWAERAAGADERVHLLSRMCQRGVTALLWLDAMDRHVRESGCLQRAQAVRNALAQTAMQVLPKQPVAGQAFLMSLVLEASSKDRDAYRLAVQDARCLVEQAPDSTLLANWGSISLALFRTDLVKTLTQRACAWPDLGCRAVMLHQLASAAYAKGAFEDMDRFCAMAYALVPPDMDALWKNTANVNNASRKRRTEFLVRELITPVMALPSNLKKPLHVQRAAEFIFAYCKYEFNFIGGDRCDEFTLCFRYFKKLIMTTFDIPVAEDSPMQIRLAVVADQLKKRACALYGGNRSDARAPMREAFINLLQPLAERFAPALKSAIAMKKVDVDTNVIAAPPSLQQLPLELFQAVLHYLPVKTTRDTFRLVNRNYQAGTRYLRLAGLLQTRLRARIGAESAQQTQSRLAGLVGACLDFNFPLALRHLMLMELIDTLPRLPAENHGQALRYLLIFHDLIAEAVGPASRREFMARGIHACQRRLEQCRELAEFDPEDDEQVLIGIDYFTGIDPTAVPIEQVYFHLLNVRVAIVWADNMNNREESERAMVFLCKYCLDTYALLGGIPIDWEQRRAWVNLMELKTTLVEQALLMVPRSCLTVQAAIASLALGLAAQNSAMHRQAQRNGLALIANTSNALLPAKLRWLATNLFHGGVIESLVERVTTWREPGAKLTMLRQLATVAWEKGAMRRMEILCAAVSRLESPDPAALEAHMQANLHRSVVERLDISTRDVIPYLLCVPPGSTKAAAVRVLALFSAGVPPTDVELKKKLRAKMLHAYSLDACARLQPRALYSVAAVRSTVAWMFSFLLTDSSQQAIYNFLKRFIGKSDR